MARKLMRAFSPRNATELVDQRPVNFRSETIHSGFPQRRYAIDRARP